MGNRVGPHVSTLSTSAVAPVIIVVISLAGYEYYTSDEL